MSRKGYIHIYTGNGKGKTTAALGLCLRGAGYGMRSIFIQLMKGRDTGELNSVKMLNSLITIEQYGSPKLLLDNNPEIFTEHKTEAMKGYERAKKILTDNSFQIVVLDEIFNLLNFGLFDLQMVIELIEKKPEPVELILTGRGAPDELINRADLVTEMRDVKHYFAKGVNAREGIEF